MIGLNFYFIYINRVFLTLESIIYLLFKIIIKELTLLFSIKNIKIMHAQICMENEFFHIMKNIVQSKYIHVNILY